MLLAQNQADAAPARRSLRCRALCAALAATLPTGAGATLALAAGGLSITPEVVEHPAQPGVVGAVRIANTTTGPLLISVTPRPWIQAPNGAIAPNPAKTLKSLVRIVGNSFTLAPGAATSVTVTLLHPPAGSSLYGAIDVIGQPPPPKKKTTGVLLGYRLIGSLRLDAPAAARRLRLRLASPRLIGPAARRQLVAALTNLGNTIDPVRGSAQIIGAGGTRTVAIGARAIVPGATVDLPLGPIKGLPHGSYRIRVSLSQASRPVLVATRTTRIH